MWIALGVGTLAAVALIVGLLFLFFADDSGNASVPRTRRSSTVQEAQATPVPEPAREKVERAESATPQIGSGRVLGTLTLNPGPNVPVSYGGTELPRQVGAFSLPVTSEGGTIEVGDESTPMRLTLAYAVSGSTLSLKLVPPPRAVATVNGKTAAGARIDKTMAVVEVKRPGAGSGMTVRLSYRPN